MTVLLGLSWAGGLPAPAGLATGLTVLRPELALLAAAAHGLFVRAKRSFMDIETALLASIAGELRAGQSLRHALAGPASHGGPLRQVARLAVSGAPLSSLEPHIREALPKSSELVVPAIGMLEASGGSAASVFELLAESHAVRISVERDQRAALAPARFSAAVLMSLVCLAVAWIVASGRLAALVSDPAGRVLGLVGLGLVATGLIVFVVILRRGLQP